MSDREEVFSAQYIEDTSTKGSIVQSVTFDETLTQETTNDREILPDIDIEDTSTKGSIIQSVTFADTLTQGTTKDREIFPDQAKPRRIITKLRVAHD